MCDSETRGGDMGTENSSQNREILALIEEMILKIETSQGGRVLKRDKRQEKLYNQSRPNNLDSAMQNDSHCDKKEIVLTSCIESKGDNVDEKLDPRRSSVESADIFRMKISELENLLSQERLVTNSLKKDRSEVESRLSIAVSERDAYLKQLQQSREECKKTEEGSKVAYERRLQELNSQIKALSKRTQEREQIGRNSFDKLRQESNQKINDLQKRLDAAVKEKDLMVVRYAEGETKVIKVESEKEKLIKNLNETVKDKEQLLGKVKAMRDDKVKMQQILDGKQAEIVNMQKEVDRLVENYRQSEQKSRWLQGKMAAESECGVEKNQKIERLTNSLKEAKEEWEKSKKQYESIIKEYQKKEEDQETVITVREQEQQVKRIIDEQLLQDKQKTEATLKNEMELLHKKFSELETEHVALKGKYKTSDEEKQELISQLNKLHGELVKKTEELAVKNETVDSLETRLSGVEEEVSKKNNDLVVASEKIVELQDLIKTMKEAFEESHVEVDNYSARNAELLSFTEKVSSKNSELLSETSNLKSRLSSISEQYEFLLKTKNNLEEKLTELKYKFDAMEFESKTAKEEFENMIKEKDETLSRLQQEVEDDKNEIKVMRKKHSMAIKELSREIQGAALKKLMEPGQGSGASSDIAVGGNFSSASRAGSLTSLDTVAGNPPSRSKATVPNKKNQFMDQNHVVDRHASVDVDRLHQQTSANDFPEIAVVDIDKTKLVEKIVKLQKAHARKNEKMELMEEQINTLLVEVGKKDRIIQHYALKEETGSVSSERSDRIKLELSKKGGSVMGSVFAAHHDGTMTLDLSLEINRKLQALLEDTLLKNMTLKENLETLGEEIANLSRSNRELIMELQIYKKITSNSS